MVSFACPHCGVAIDLDADTIKSIRGKMNGSKTSEAKKASGKINAAKATRARLEKQAQKKAPQTEG
ncbi:MAG: hypothetical protein Ta2A_09150 [Treponemataceae bacterium]|nr:MAG: hypothetical protein Ta2A_09150 [Treponemataceae bacterium]